MWYDSITWCGSQNGINPFWVLLCNSQNADSSTRHESAQKGFFITWRYMSDYWLKLYIEILDDPKMAVMPDRIWRRTIEIFLVAKRMNKDGHLPDTKQIAWMIRMNQDELEIDMTQISSTGIIVQEPGGWYIPNFKKRQEAVGGAERTYQSRKRDQKQQYYGNDTTVKQECNDIVTFRYIETETETETEPQTEEAVVVNSNDKAIATVFKAYENEIGILTAAVRDRILDCGNDYPAQWIVDAIKESALKNKRFWGYTEGILKRWKVEGRSSASGIKKVEMAGKIGIVDGVEMFIPDKEPF